MGASSHEKKRPYEDALAVALAIVDMLRPACGRSAVPDKETLYALWGMAYVEPQARK